MKANFTIFKFLDAEPLLIVLAGSNGAGKSTFHASHLARKGLPFVNADNLARESGLDSYAAARFAATLRAQYLREKRSFIFETVFSDPAGEKLNFLREAEEAGYTVVLAFIGIPDARVSEERVGLRVLKGGHDVPIEKIAERFPRTLANLLRATKTVQHVIVYDNANLQDPYVQLAIFRSGSLAWRRARWPKWFSQLMAA